MSLKKLRYIKNNNNPHRQKKKQKRIEWGQVSSFPLVSVDECSSLPKPALSQMHTTSHKENQDKCTEKSMHIHHCQRTGSSHRAHLGPRVNKVKSGMEGQFCQSAAQWWHQGKSDYTNRSHIWKKVNQWKRLFFFYVSYTYIFRELWKNLILPI